MTIFTHKAFYFRKTGGKRKKERKKINSNGIFVICF